MNPQFLRQRHNVVAALEPLHRHPTELLRMPSRSFLGHLQSPFPAKGASSVCLKIGVHSTSACVLFCARKIKTTQAEACATGPRRTGAVAACGKTRQALPQSSCENCRLMIPLRLVVDTNIVVSAALKPEGLQRTVLLLAITKPARLYVSAAIFAEYRDVLSRQELQIRKGLRQQLLQLIGKRGHWVVPARRLQVASDPGDNVFLECADGAQADYLVTGNTRHFPRFWKKTKVITSREFDSLVTPHLIT